MTALPKHSVTTAAPLDFSMLIEASEAAKLLGTNRDALTRRCRQELAPRGMAFHVRPPTGGTARWYIDRRFDMRLAGGTVGAKFQTPELDAFPRHQVERAWLRVDCVKQLRAARTEWPGLMRDWLPTLIESLQRQHPTIRISRTSLLRWDALYQTKSDIIKLIDTRGGNTRADGDPAAWKLFTDQFLDEREPSIREIWKQVRRAARENNWQWCSYKACQRQLNKRIPPEIQLKHRNPARWRREMAPYIEQDTEAWAAGQCWIGDHKQCDVWVRAGRRLVRPWLTAWMDWRTRRVVGWTLSTDPNSSTILAALRHGLLDERNFGGPAAVWIDNGKDYDCFAFHGQTKEQRKRKRRINELNETQTKGIFDLLDIEVHFSLAYNPNGKARLERWFRDLEPFYKSLPTYTGRDIDTKPEGLNAALKEPRRVPMFEHVRDRIAKFIAGSNARTDHSISDLVDEAGQPLSPDQAMASWCPTRRQRDPSDLDLLLHMWHKPVRMSRNGITINIAGKALTYGGHDAAFVPLKALHAKDRPWLHVAYDPDDLSTIKVYDDKYRFIDVANLNGLGGVHGGDAIGRQHISALMKRKTARNKALQVVKNSHEVEYLTDAELLAEEVAREKRESDDTLRPPPSLTPVRNPLEGQAEAVKRAVMRKAAGAEGMDAAIDLLADDAVMSRVQRRDDDDFDDADFEADVYSFQNATANVADAQDTDVDLLSGPAPEEPQLPEIDVLEEL